MQSEPQSAESASSRSVLTASVEQASMLVLMQKRSVIILQEPLNTSLSEEMTKIMENQKISPVTEISTNGILLMYYCVVSCVEVVEQKDIIEGSYANLTYPSSPSITRLNTS